VIITGLIRDGVFFAALAAAILIGCNADPISSPNEKEPAPASVKISYLRDVLQGHYSEVKITTDIDTARLEGFEFILSYDTAVLTLAGVSAGNIPLAQEWDYFSYTEFNLGATQPGGLAFVQIRALADTRSGNNLRSDRAVDTSKSLAVATFLISNDRTLECTFAPVRFYWLDWYDNVLYAPFDTIAFARAVYDTVGIPLPLGADSVPGWFPPTAPDLDSLSFVAVPIIDFVDGGFRIYCDSIDPRGDINVNGICNEVADAVMYTDYFIVGLSAFNTHTEASIEESDVNADGNTLTVADFQYLSRIIVGDALPYDRIHDTLSLVMDTQTVNGSLMISSSADSSIGAVFVKAVVSGDSCVPSLGSDAADMDLKFAVLDDTLRALIYNIGSHRIPSGDHSLLQIEADSPVTLLSVEAAEFYGRPMRPVIRVPMPFQLDQNYPNPFSSSTTITLHLDQRLFWSIRIFDVDGDLIRAYSGYDGPGVVSIEWDGTYPHGKPLPDGVYFYRAEAGGFSVTRTMTLIR